MPRTEKLAVYDRLLACRSRWSYRLPGALRTEPRQADSLSYGRGQRPKSDL